jgi:hypothetical protein
MGTLGLSLPAYPVIHSLPAWAPVAAWATRTSIQSIQRREDEKFQFMIPQITALQWYYQVCRKAPCPTCQAPGHLTLGLDAATSGNYMKFGTCRRLHVSATFPFMRQVLEVGGEELTTCDGDRQPKGTRSRAGLERNAAQVEFAQCSFSKAALWYLTPADGPSEDLKG